MLLQPSDQLHKDLKDILSCGSVGGRNFNETSHLIHLHIILSMASDWGEYIEHLWAEVAKLVSQCHFYQRLRDSANKV